MKIIAKMEQSYVTHDRNGKTVTCSRGKRIITPLNEKNRRINIQLIKSFEKFL